MDSARCRDLALEGERLCRTGEWKAGVIRLEAALKEGCSDVSTLCFVYSQLGTAYFYLRDYDKSLDYHRQDAMLMKRAGDRAGEAKAYANLGNVLKAIGRFDEAVASFHRQLALAQEADDRVRESKAFYSLGNVYHSKGKEAANGLQLDPGQYPVSVREALQNAACFYEASLQLVQELGDRVAEGRACGNLGNTHYLLGNFERAIKYHTTRLEIAQEFRDYSAERRACTNLGNAYVFLCQFNAAAEYYRKTLLVALETKDRVVEAQACYSLGNTYTLLKDHAKAIEYHLRHFDIARELCDRVGEARACWSLGNAYTAMGNYRQAFSYATTHYQLAVESNDLNGAENAKQNLKELNRLLGVSSPPVSSQTADLKKLQREWDGQIDDRMNTEVFVEDQHSTEINGDTAAVASLHIQSSEHCIQSSSKNYEKRKYSPSQKEAPLTNVYDSERRWTDEGSPSASGLVHTNGSSGVISPPPAASALAFSRERSMTVTDSEDGQSPNVTDSFICLLSNNQGRRIDDQRYSWPRELSANNSTDEAHAIDQACGLDDSFLDMLMRCQGNRFEEQRSAPPLPRPPPPPSSAQVHGRTIPDEDFFNMIVRLQSQRLEDQRSSDPM